jgi:hypothetical protein
MLASLAIDNFDITLILFLGTVCAAETYIVYSSVKDSLAERTPSVLPGSHFLSRLGRYLSDEAMEPLVEGVTDMQFEYLNAIQNAKRLESFWIGMVYRHMLAFSVFLHFALATKDKLFRSLAK